MKTVMKENRIEQIADVELATYKQNGWREIDPKTGKPIPKAGKPDTESQLRQQVADLTNDLKGYYEQNGKLKAENEALTASLDATNKELGEAKKELADALKSLKKQEKADSK